MLPIRSASGICPALVSVPALIELAPSLPLTLSVTVPAR
jgi:hypothetical protein